MSIETDRAIYRLEQAALAREWVMQETRQAVLDGYRTGLTKSEIYRCSGLSRPTIHKWIKADADRAAQAE